MIKFTKKLNDKDQNDKVRENLSYKKTHKNNEIIAVMHAERSWWGDPPNVLGSTILEDRKEIFLLGKALKFRVIFKKCALKLIEMWKVLRKF